eukprot:150457_1
MEDENEMFKQYKYKLSTDIEELNGMLNASHSKHRAIKYLYDELNKSNKKLLNKFNNINFEKITLQKENELIKHENKQIIGYKNYIKQQFDELQLKLIRYKNKYKNIYKECNIIRKKTIILDQLLRLSDNERNELEFDKKSGHIREKILIDLIKKINRENNDLLYKSYDILMVKHIEMER